LILSPGAQQQQMIQGAVMIDVPKHQLIFLDQAWLAEINHPNSIK
jgi:hypothetical protein